MMASFIVGIVGSGFSKGLGIELSSLETSIERSCVYRKAFYSSCDVNCTCLLARDVTNCFAW